MPLGSDLRAELEGLAAILAERFPGLPVTVGAPEPLPEGVRDPLRRQVLWEDLAPKLPSKSGVLYVLSEDLSFRTWNYAFATYDIPGGRAALSVSRLQSEEGQPVPPGAPLDGPTRSLARARFRNLATSAVGKLLGMSFPCRAQTCLLKWPSRIQDVDLRGQSFCPLHRQEYEHIARERHLAPTR